ncbi:MAG: hypothetical protein AB7O66_13505 [Limisphaerales bacterium]
MLFTIFAAMPMVFPATGFSDSIRVPNGSFERPATEFADPRIESWRKSTKPDWYDEAGGFPWEQLSGVFLNTTPDQPDHLVNVVGAQAAFLFAVPQVALFLDNESGSGSASALVPTFEPSHTYRLSVAVLGGGGGMKPGVSLTLGLYYRDASGAAVPIASTEVINDPTLFADPSRFVDFHVDVPRIRRSDPWAEKPIGIRIESTVSPDLAGGYWDIEEVRLSREIVLPNGSFELPSTEFADPRIESWSKSAKPDWYDEAGGFPWEQLSGVFLNTAPGAPDHITNVDGRQAAFLFAVPQVEVFQDADSTPSHDFDARYVPGRSYQLSAGVVGGGGGMKPGVTLALSLYHLDSAGQRVPVATTTITNSAALFPTQNQFVEFTVASATVDARSPWAGRNIGVAITSTVQPDLAGGYWDIENVRLTEKSGAVLRNPAWKAGQFSVELTSEPGTAFEIQTAAALGLPESGWSGVGTVTNTTGTLTWQDPASGSGPRYYRARELP